MTRAAVRIEVEVHQPEERGIVGKWNVIPGDSIVIRSPEEGPLFTIWIKEVPKRTRTEETV